MNDIIKFVGSLENSDLLTDDATETVKHEIQKEECRFLVAVMALTAASLIAPMASLFIEPVASSLIISINGKVKGQEGGFPSLLALLLMMKDLGKGIKRGGKGVATA